MEDPGSLLAAAMRANAERPVLGMLHLMLTTAATRPGHPASAYFQERYQLMQNVFADHVRTLQAAGEVKPDRDPEYIASAVIAAADGIRFQWFNDRAVDMAAHVQRTWEVLLGRSPRSADSDKVSSKPDFARLGSVGAP